MSRFPIAALLLLALVVTPAAAQPTTQSDEPASVRSWLWPDNAAQLTCEERGGTLRAVGRRLWRTRDGRTQLVIATRADGLGVVVDLAPAPDGATFVASAFGLFFTRPGTGVDAVDLRDGVPHGRPIGIHVDRTGRLWMMTEEDFGCVDTAYFYGRTFDRVDGLRELKLIEGDAPWPSGSWTGFGVAPDGGILLHTSTQVFAYIPGQLHKPTVEVLKVNGKPYERGKAYRAGRRAALVLKGTCDGVPTFRYRLSWSHQWEPLEGDRLIVEGLRPGHNVVQVMAIDRELDRSDPVPVTFDVPYPVMERSSTVYGLCGLAELVTLLLVGRWVRRRGLRALGVGLLWVVVVTAVAVQVRHGILDLARATPYEGFWMFLDRSKKHGVLYKLELIGIRPDGSEREIAADRGGGPALRPQHQLVRLINGSFRYRQDFLKHCNQRHPGDPLVGFVVGARRWRLTRRGPIPVAGVEYVRFAPKE